jgi:hypothetical protein
MLGLFTLGTQGAMPKGFLKRSNVKTKCLIIVSRPKHIRWPMIKITNTSYLDLGLNIEDTACSYFFKFRWIALPDLCYVLTAVTGAIYRPYPVVLYRRELSPLARWAQIELYILSFCYLWPVNSDSSKTEKK